MFQFIKNQPAVMLFMIMVLFSRASMAGINPYDKSKTLKFGTNVQWQVSKSGVMKSGVNKRRGTLHYYHLIISEQQLLLKLTKNDASAKKNNTWPLETFDVLDVIVNGSRLPIFQWCLDNRVNPVSYKMLRQDTTVNNDICKIDLAKSELIIKLDAENIVQIKKAAKLLIDIKLGKYVSHLNYSMQGFDEAFTEYSLMNKKINQPTAKAVVIQPVVAKPKVIKVKMCHVRPPVEFSGKIKTINYPCNDRPLRTKAKKNMSSLVTQEKNRLKAEQQKKSQHEKYLAEMERKKQQELMKQEELAMQQYELEIERKNTEKWVRRCKKHWNKGVSPCYCRPYLEHAPAGTADTCSK